MRAFTPRLAPGQLAVAVLLLLTAPSGRAADAAASAAPTGWTRPQRSFGVGATFGFWAGAGVVAGGGGDGLKGWETAGYAPVLVFSNAKSADKAVKFNGYSALQVGAELGVPVMARERTELSLVLGYRFNTVLGHGGGAGARFLFAVTPGLALGAVGGLQLFPEARQRLDETQHYPADRNPGLPPALQGGVNFELIWSL